MTSVEQAVQELARAIRDHKTFKGGTVDAEGKARRVHRCSFCGWEGDDPDSHVAAAAVQALQQVQQARGPFPEELAQAIYAADLSPDWQKPVDGYHHVAATLIAAGWTHP
jgi:hypothetical protein